MGSLLYFVIIAFKFTSALGTQSIPLKCFLQNYNFLNIFGTEAVHASHYIRPTINSLRFGILRACSNNVNNDGWILDTKNLQFHGLDDAILDDFGFNLVTNVSQMTFHTDMLVTYDYKTSGSLFSIPINGEGFTQVPLKNVQIGMTMPFDIIQANGNKFIELRNFNYWYDVKDNAQFIFSNLYYGNKELSDSMHCLMNKNWKYITIQFGKGFMDKVADNVFNLLKNYMLAMPLKDFTTC